MIDTPDKTNELIQLMLTSDSVEVTFERNLYGTLLSRVGRLIISVSRVLRHYVLGAYGFYLANKGWTKIKRVTVTRDGVPLPADEMKRLAPAIGEYIAAVVHFHSTRTIGKMFTEEADRVLSEYFCGKESLAKFTTENHT